VYPAIDVGKSGTRKEELLFTTEELNRVTLLRQFFLSDMPEVDAMEFLIKAMSRSKNNKEFFQQMAQS
jgi:transcription termination factor Rho